jgi:hypothetical protein
MMANLTNLLSYTGFLNFTRNRDLCLFRDEIKKNILEIINKAGFRKKSTSTKTPEIRTRLANYCMIIPDTTVMHIDFISIKLNILAQNNDTVQKCITRPNLARRATTGFHRRPILGTWRSENAAISYHEECIVKHQETHRHIK